MDVHAIPGVIGHAIQLAVAPVFLLTGVAGLLAVMANRLARVIDRARWWAQVWPTLSPEARAHGRKELAMLERRRHLASWSINLCTCAALVICLVVVALFMEEFIGAYVGWVVGLLFMLAMLAIVGGLTAFLREVYLATHSTVIDASHLDRELPSP